MTKKPWGDEPAISQLMTVHKTIEEEKDGKTSSIDRCYYIGGFTKLERACIDLKVPHPDLPPELRELILESRRLDYAGKAIDALLSSAEFCKNVSLASIGMTKTEEQEIHPKTFSKVSWLIANAMLKELDKK